MVLVDSVSRYVEGVLNEASIEEESFLPITYLNIHSIQDQKYS